MKKNAVFFLSVIVSVLALIGVSHALDPEEVLVAVNRNSGDGLELARYYMTKRGIPAENIVKLDLPEKETISRDLYSRNVADPVRKYLDRVSKRWGIRCILLMYGMPLKIEGVSLSAAETFERQKKLAGFSQDKESSNAFLQKTDTRASLDSEISLVLKNDYPVEGWILNPFYIANTRKNIDTGKNDVLMVSRLDGPKPEIVRRMIDDSIAAEEKGLSGRAYFDARWQYPKKGEDLSAYAVYDKSIHDAAAMIRKNKVMPVVVNSSAELFGKGECPDAALYCGWYSLKNYRDAFSWNRGAVGYHIASGECATLKSGLSRVWCKKMLEKGAAATLGPVSEPYVSAFPPPEIFFKFLTDGDLSLAEVYLVSIPHLSWKMVCLGDPLYRPFKTSGGESGTR